MGRVALSEPYENLMDDFYIGSCYTPLPEGTTVVSWAAGVASLFYEGGAAAMHSPEGLHPCTVVARRSFKAAGDRLEDFEDDIEPGTPAGAVFASEPCRFQSLPRRSANGPGGWQQHCPGGRETGACLRARAEHRTGEECVEVLSIESLVREWANLPSRDLHPVDERWFHSDWTIGRIVDRAARRLEGSLRKMKRRGEKACMLVNELVRDTPTHR